MLMTLNRHHTLNTLFGHSIQFVTGEPVHVPPLVYQDAVAIGAVRHDGALPDVLPEEVVVVPDETPREEHVLAAVALIMEANDREDFTAAGKPTVRAVERVSSLNVDAREVERAWQRFHNEKAAK